MKRNFKNLYFILIYSLCIGLIITSAIFVFNFYKLPTDSGYHYTVSKQIIQNKKFIFWDSWSYGGSLNPYTPLFHILTALFYNLSYKDLYISTQLLVLFAYIFFFLMIFIMMKKFYDFTTAIFSMLLLGLSSLWIKFSYGKYPQIFATLLIPFFLVYFVDFLKTKNKKNLLFSSFFFSNIVLFHHLTGFLIAISSFLICILFLIKDRGIIKHLILFGLISTILILPWFSHSVIYHITTLSSQIQENDLSLYRVESNLNNIFSVKSDIHLPILIFIFGLLSLFFLIKKFKTKDNKIFFVLFITPLLISLSIFFNIPFQNYRFLIFASFFLVLISSLYLNHFFKKISNSTKCILIFLLVIFVILSFSDRINYLSTIAYTKPLNEYSFIKELESSSKYVPIENIVINDGYTKLAWWVPGAMERKTFLVGRKLSYLGTPIYSKILVGQEVLESSNLSFLEPIINNYGNLYIIIPKKIIPRITFNFDWTFEPNYTKFYLFNQEKIKSSIIYNGTAFDIAVISKDEKNNFSN